MKTKTLTNYLDDFLQIGMIPDYGPQGLQVESDCTDVRRIALAVDTAPDTILAAADWDADMLLVHHGILWRNVERIAGPLGHRVRLLLKNDIHLYAAHLALDAHPLVGNNAVLADLLGVTIDGWWCEAQGTKIGVIGRYGGTLADLKQDVTTKLSTNARVLDFGPPDVRNLAIVSGFGADRVAEAKEAGADTLLTGETSHANYYAASDLGMNVVFAGHYATETVGVRALGKYLEEQFDVESQFFDFPTAM